MKSKSKHLITLLFLLGWACLGFSQNDSTKMDVDPEYYPEVEEPEVDGDEVFEFFSVETKAEYKHGGDAGLRKFLGKNISYPEEAKESGVEGTVIIRFVVDKDGRVTNVQLYGNRKVGYGCEEEAIRVVKLTSGDWTPAMQRDKPVRMQYMLPIKFSLK